MKKIWSIIALLGYSMSIFAYGSSYDDGFDTFITIVTLIAGILSLILFFKIWGMTKNVKKILQKLELANPSIAGSDRNNLYKLREYVYLQIVNGNTCESVKKLNDLVWNEAMNLLPQLSVKNYDNEFIIIQSGSNQPVKSKDVDEVCKYVRDLIKSEVLSKYRPMYEILSEKVPETLTDFDYHQYRNAMGLKSLKEMQDDNEIHKGDVPDNMTHSNMMQLK